MTQQEQELLKGLTDRVKGTSLSNKDAEAESMLRGALGNNPDALYILCQTALVQQFAMSNAQRQLTEARAELDRLRQAAKPQEHGSFLGNLFGLGKSDNSASAQTAPAQGGYAPVPSSSLPPQAGYGQPIPQPGYGQPVPQAYGQPMSPYGYGAPPVAGGGPFGGGGGFLQSAAQTAAGVVAGEFAFRALEDVFHGFGGGGEGRGFGGGSEVVNNYYGDAGDRGSGDGFGDRLQQADGLDSSISPDIEDRRGDSSGFLGGSGDGDNFAASGDSDYGGTDDSSGGDDFSSGDSGDSNDSY